VVIDDPLGGKERILLVEDQDPVRIAARRILTARGYTVLEATDGADAIAKIGESMDSFDMVLTDLVMPHMGGGELVAWVRARRPECPAVYMSGYSPDPGLLKGEPEIPFLQKPFSATELATIVRETLNKREASPAPNRRLSLEVA
jgi:two-component system, cell cycle sensor histidine kinase and response regulator CckA